MQGGNLASLYLKESSSDKPVFYFDKAWDKETGFHISGLKVQHLT
jgi:hypothetical protein